MKKKTFNYFSLFSLLLMLFAVSINAQEVDAANKADSEQASEESAAVDPLKNSAEAGERWLNLLDERKYPQSWETGSLTLKLTVPKKHWIALMERIRKPLGSLSSRNLVDQRPAKDPKGLPKGDYMVLLYKSSFSRNESVNELLTLVEESDGRWRVLTYQVQ